MAEPALDDDTGNRRVQRTHKGGERPIYKPEKEISAEDALAQATAVIKAKDAELARANERTVAAEKRAGAATTNAAETQLARIADQETTITNSLAAAETAEASAQALLETALEEQDAKKISAALNDAANAKLAKAKWADIKADFDAKKPTLVEKAKAAAKAAETTGDQPTGESAAWIAAHPKFNSDPDYRADAMGAHEAAIQRGYKASSRAYIDHLNTTLTRLHGENHGQEGAVHRESTRTSGGDSSSFAAPPSRDLDSTFSATIGNSTLRLSKNADGREVLSGTIPGEWVDAAKWNGMSDVEYSISMLKQMEEDKRKGGSSAIRHGEGLTFR